MAVHALPPQHVGFLIGDMNVSSELGEQVQVSTGEPILHYGQRTAVWRSMTKHMELIPCGLSHENKARQMWTAIDKVLCNFPRVLVEVAGAMGRVLGSPQPPAGSDHWPICVHWGCADGDVGLPLWTASHPEYPIKVAYWREVLGVDTSSPQSTYHDVRAIVENAVADIRRARTEVPDEPRCLHALCLQSLHHAMAGNADLFWQCVARAPQWRIPHTTSLPVAI
eukprot:2920221-Amphidinium_carterae.1